MLKGSEGDCLPASALILPGREERDEDKRAQELLPTKSAAPYVNPDDYFPVIAQGRADETTRKAYPVTINGKRVRQRPLPIRRSAQGTMGRYSAGRRRSFVVRRLHHVDHDPRTLRSRLADAVRDHDECVERNRWQGGYLFISPQSRPSPALKEQINPSQKRRYTAISRALGSDLSRRLDVVRGLGAVCCPAAIRGLGLGIAGRRILIHGNRVLLAPFFLGLRPASSYG
jgi:hypothetical protein